MPKTTIHFEEDHLLFLEYPFTLGTIQKGSQLYAHQINQVLYHTAPPVLIINANEVIFIDRSLEIKLKAFCKRHTIHTSQRTDIWSWINEPFLDTEFTKEVQKRATLLLAANGFPNVYEVAGIRQKIETTMLDYNTMFWESVNLGHFDTLLAFRDANKVAYTSEFYWWTMEVALRNYDLPHQMSDSYE